MCGIAGEIAFGDGAADAVRVRAMCERMVHRGPDEAGLHVSPSAALGVRRLSIIGRTGGSQPFTTESGTVAVFNGEIYNHRRLRKELEADGASFRTTSDGEVIVHLYERFGDRCAEHLEGMFAAAIYDPRRSRLLLIRDRPGKKPLFYFVARDRVIFASTLAALLRHPLAPRRADPEAIDRFLSFRIIPAPFTGFAGVRKVEPGTSIAFDRAGSSTARYWSFPLEGAGAPPPHDFREAARELRAELEGAVERRLESEVPLGVFLSGGLDSALVAALAARVTGRVLSTFSVGFEEARFDERAHARTVAEHLGTAHHEHVITVRDARESLPHLIQSTGEPFAFPSIIAVYWMARLARGKATVALGGDGADELFAGYSRYRVLDALPVLSADASSRVDRELLSERPDDPATQYRAILTDGLRDGLKRRLYSRSFIERLGGSFPANYLAEPFRALGGDRPRLFRALDLDRRFWLPDAQLVKVDVGAMESSIEVRSPFLDPRVVDFAARVPMEMKLGAGLEKRILREAARDLLPEGIVERKKQELAVPLESWLSTALRAEISETLTARESLERGYFEPGALKELVERWDRRDAYALWTLYMLERWHVAFEVTA